MGNLCNMNTKNDADTQTYLKSHFVRSKGKSNRETMPDDEFYQINDSDEKEELISDLKNMTDDPYYSDFDQSDNEDEDTDWENFDCELTINRKGYAKELLLPVIVNRVVSFANDTVKRLYKKYGQLKIKQKDIPKGLSEKNSEVRFMQCEATGRIYYGEWNTFEECEEGRGISVSSNGSLYEGFWCGGKKDGYGRIIQPDGVIYQGDFQEDQCHGYGVLIDGVEGYIYKGSWRFNLPHGTGHQNCLNGIKYLGEFYKGSMTGKCKYQIRDGCTFKGEIEDGTFNGRGEIIWKNGDKYAGELRNDKMHGFGKFTWANGKAYEGQFRKGLKHGEGVLYKTDGTRKKGKWRKDKFKRHSSSADTNDTDKSYKKKAFKHALHDK